MWHTTEVEGKLCRLQQQQQQTHSRQRMLGQRPTWQWPLLRLQLLQLRLTIPVEQPRCEVCTLIMNQE